MNFDYKIKKDDKSIESIKKDEIFYNYLSTKLNKFDSSFEDLYYYILDDDEVSLCYKYPKKNFNKKYVLDSINLWKTLGINLHDINVFKLFRNGSHVVIYDSGVFDSFKSVDPSCLKVNFKHITQWDSKVISKEILSDDYKNIIFNEIVVPKVDKKLASTIYAHEISHTQLMSSNGGGLSIFNEETLPILMEFIFAENLDNSRKTLKYVNNERLICIRNFINNLTLGNKMSYEFRVMCEKYIISSLNAIELYRLYRNFSNNQKKEMLKDINNIFEGEKNIEDMIDKYNVNYKEVAVRKSLKLY